MRREKRGKDWKRERRERTINRLGFRDDGSVPTRDFFLRVTRCAP